MAKLGILLFALFLLIYVVAFLNPSLISFLIPVILLDIILIFILVLKDRIKAKKEEDKDDYSKY